VVGLEKRHGREIIEQKATSLMWIRAAIMQSTTTEIGELSDDCLERENTGREETE